MASEQIEITNGPGKFDLMIALFDTAHAYREVTFVTHAGEVSFKVLGVLVDDLKNESWRVSGTCGELRVKADFSTRTRKGRIEFESP